MGTIEKSRTKLERLANLHTLYHDKARWAREYLEEAEEYNENQQTVLECMRMAAYWRAEALKDYARYKQQIDRLTLDLAECSR